MRISVVLLVVLGQCACEYQVRNCEGPLCVSASGGLVDGQSASECAGMAGCSVRCPNRLNVDEHMLREVTLARRLYNSCPSADRPVLANMSFDQILDTAASEHAQDMVRYSFESATGSDGLTVYDRVTTHATSSFSLDDQLAQLVATGAGDAYSAVSYWLASPAECALLLSQKYTHLGASCDSDGHSPSRWSLVLGGAGS